MGESFKALKRHRSDYFEAKKMHEMALKIDQESGLEMKAVLKWTTANISKKRRSFRKSGQIYRKSESKIYVKKKFSDRTACPTP